ncbi:MAG: TIGR04255 family protein [Pseudomonas sp.]
MGKRFKNAPVFFTIGQVQHNPLLSLGSYLPQIQERMRKAGYPDFRRSVQVQLAFQAASNPEAETAAQPTVQQVELFHFYNIESTRGFLLQANSISFQATTYDTFDAFHEEFVVGLNILNDSVDGLSYFERLGLRYLDAVAPKQGEDIDLYIEKELTGLPSRMSDAIFAHSFSESLLIAEGIGQVVARTIIQNNRLTFPPDINPSGLKVQAHFESIAGIHAIIDTDGSFSERRPFDLTEIQSRMDSLHDLIGKCFRATATDFARASWDA